LSSPGEIGCFSGLLTASDRMIVVRAAEQCPDNLKADPSCVL
jgi:hypothetical protein